MSNSDNFDQPEELDADQIPDGDVDFDDFEDGKDRSAGASWKNSPLFKFGIVALVIVIVIALVSILSGDKVTAPTSVVGKGSSVKEAPGINEVTPVMKEAIEEKNDQRIDEAQKQGISAIPTPIAPPKTLLEVPQDDSQSEDPLLRWQQMQTERAKAQRDQQMMQEQQTATDPQRDAKVTALAQSMNQQIGNILGSQKAADMKNMKVFSLKGGASGTVDPNGNVIATNTGVSSVVQQQLIDQKPAKVIVPAGKIEYAQMILEANSDIPGPVIVLMASGPFSGGKLIGKFTAQEEYLVITFSTLVTKKGTSIPVNAYALDPATSLTGMATDVDHRYLKRIILPAAAKFVEGLGDAYAQTTTSTTQNATTTTTASEDLNTKQEFGNAVGEAAGSVAEFLEESGNSTKPLIVVAAGTPMGILFMDPVKDQDVLRARSGVSAMPQQTGQQVPVQGGYGQGFQQPGLMNQMQQLQYGLQGQQLLQQNGTYNGTYNNNGLLNNYGGATTTTSTTGQQ